MESELLARQIIQNEFKRLQGKNPKFSLRSFAKKIQLHPSLVSKILTGKGSITLTTFAKICSALRLESEEIQKITHHLRKRNLRILNGLPTNKIAGVYTLLKDEQLEVLSHWKYFAILSLFETQKFDGTLKNIQTQLGLTSSAALEGVSRLIRLGLLENSELPHTYRITGKNFETTTDIPHALIRKFLNDGLKLAQSALAETPIDQRDYSSITIAINKSKIPAAKKMILEFRRKLAGFLEEGPKEEVYRLSIQLFPVKAFENNEEVDHLSEAGNA